MSDSNNTSNENYEEVRTEKTPLQEPPAQPDPAIKKTQKPVKGKIIVASCCVGTAELHRIIGQHADRA